MSTNKTQNYNLHSWVPEDDFIRSEFNDNFTGIDAALKTLSDGLAAETSARAAAVTAEKTAREQAVAAEKTAREQAVTAEQNARKQAITAEQNARAAAISTLTTAKAELVVGAYTGDGTESRTISLGFTPRAVLLVTNYGRMYYNLSNSKAVEGGLFLPNHPLKADTGSVGDPGIAGEIVTGGFKVTSRSYSRTNHSNTTYYYIAVK